MAEEAKKVEQEPAPEPCLEALSAVAEVAEEGLPPPLEEKSVDDCKALAIVENVVLARVDTMKRLLLIRVCEESEKSKAENKAHKKLSFVGAWENSKKVTPEAELKKIEEQLEKKKAEYIEKTKNKICMIHKQAEVKRAMIKARRGEDVLKAEEVAAKYRATGTGPKKLLGCF